ncbi:MAG: hypothetical protein OSB02_08425 [Rhodospirillaceae bacterium]|nr:hypothetical protein [Rhodospirillaceae bacterium]
MSDFFMWGGFVWCVSLLLWDAGIWIIRLMIKVKRYVSICEERLNVVVCDSPDMTFVKGLLSLLRLENLGFMAVATQG